MVAVKKNKAEREEGGAYVSLQKAFRVLELLAERSPRGVTEIAAELGLEKSGVSRLLKSLGSLGYAVQSSDRGRYQLSARVLLLAEQYLGGETQMTFIEPYPETALQLFGNDPKYRERVLRQRLQDAPLSLFTELAAGDILLIDSSHVGKTGSDVLDYLFRILPRLRPGVLVHIHDIFFPFEYPTPWIVDQNRSWNEAYFLRAFLCANPNFRVLYWSDWIYKCRRHLFETRMPLCVQYRGGSLWLQSVNP